jgi:predicted ATPase
MVDKLIVKDFGPIRDAEMDIKKTTVLIGPQGSGKSTLAKLVAITNDLGIFPDDKSSIKQLFEKYGVQEYVQSNSEITLESSEFYLNYINRDFDIVLNEANQNRANELINADPGFEGILSNVSFEDYKKQVQEQKQRKNQSLNLTRDFITARSFYSQFFKSIILKSYPVYLPTERQIFSVLSNSIWSLINSNINLPKNIVELGSWFESARNLLGKLEVPFLKITYQYEGYIDRIYFDTEKSVKLSESASGFQSVIPMNLIIENLNDKETKHKFIIEEPELNLYPTTQKSLIYYLADSCTRGENELMMTTHSPYVLAALNNLIFAYKVAYEKPEKAVEVEKVIPKDSWLNPDDFAAYFVADGTVRSIINPKTGLISENELDGVSDEIGDEFDTLMDIYRSKKG